MAKKEKIDIQYGLRRIKDLAFFIDEEKEVNPEKISIEFKINLTEDLNKEQLDLVIDVSFLHDADYVFMSGKVLTSFVVKDIIKYQNKKGKIDLPEGIMTTFFSIAVTHARALIAKAAMGSKYNGLYVPIIANPGQLFKELIRQNDN